MGFINYFSLYKGKEVDGEFLRIGPLETDDGVIDRQMEVEKVDSLSWGER